MCIYYKGPVVMLNVNVIKLDRFAKFELTPLQNSNFARYHSLVPTDDISHPVKKQAKFNKVLKSREQTS